MVARGKTDDDGDVRILSTSLVHKVFDRSRRRNERRSSSVVGAGDCQIAQLRPVQLDLVGRKLSEPVDEVMSDTDRRRVRL